MAAAKTKERTGWWGGFVRFWRKLWLHARQENLHRVMMVILVLVVVSTFGISAVEPDINIINGLWWSIVTLTTVGYGDISPVTATGRMIAIVLMITGIGLLGTLSATIASFLVDRRLKENRGMSSTKLQNHIILFEWNHRSRMILNELRADPHTADAPVVLISDIDHKPVDDENLLFIQGEPSEETLTRANLAEAETVLILGDDRLDFMARDAKVVLTTLTVETINPRAYTIVELADQANVAHCKRAQANEIVVTDELSSNLISRSAVNHGISHIVSEILSAQRGNELYKVAVPGGWVGRPLLDVMIDLKREYAGTLMGVQHGLEGDLTANPAADYVLANDDFLIVVADKRPQLN